MQGKVSTIYNLYSPTAVVYFTLVKQQVMAIKISIMPVKRKHNLINNNPYNDATWLAVNKTCDSRKKGKGAKEI
jgi:hypothetical protein